MEFKGQIEKALHDAGITEKVIKRGDVWVISDELIIFPEERLPKGKRTKHNERPALILSCEEDLTSIRPLTAIISPLSTVKIKAVTDFILSAGTGGLLEDSVARLGLIQPILKIDLNRKLGTIGSDILDQIMTVVLCNLGVLQRNK